ncbi:MAG: ADP-ribosylglycohydrolase family protein [Proteobacteria bacterium]|nr:ADP-ribosylglycohydrolase family protein [Pseudomonadota bacterium]
MDPITKNDRIQGALLGLAWGDALGCPVEGWNYRTVQKVYGNYENLPEAYPLEKIQPFGEKTMRRLRPLGLHSDDTQLAMGIINICLDTGHWSCEEWVKCLVRGHPIFPLFPLFILAGVEAIFSGHGPGFRAALRETRFSGRIRTAPKRDGPGCPAA